MIRRGGLLRAASPSPVATARRPAYFQPNGSSHGLEITEDNLSALVPTVGQLTAVGSYEVPEATELWLEPGAPVYPFLMGYEDLAVTQAASITLTLSNAAIRTQRYAPSLPTSNHPDIMVVVESGPDSIGTVLPVTTFADGTTAPVVDGSGLTTSGGSYTLRTYYLPVGGTFAARVNVPSGGNGRYKQLIKTGTRAGYTRDPSNLGSFLYLARVNGYSHILVPAFWTVTVLASYPNQTPSLNYSQIVLPARLSPGVYLDPVGESRRAIQRLGI